ncbi:MAG: outer membrane protein assembly factor BamD [Proteobacteria bacterium]|nr:outer membrane protein assembly factor BamD [Pseudomonadota bacterium]
MISTHTPNSNFTILRFAGTVIMLFALLANSGCSSSDKDELDTELLSAEALYGQAEKALLTQKWEDALVALKRLEARYPYGRFAKQAQLDTAYAHYKLDQDGLAIAAADRFIALNPTHASVDYAFYIKGLSSFKEEEGWRGMITGRTTLADRDPDSILKALDAFGVIVKRFPNSRYKNDAEKRIVYLNAARAEQQISVARFYYLRGAYVAAINRSKIVLNQYGSGPQVEDALGIMYLSYQQMQMPALAADTQRILTLNYPDSSYLTTNIKSSGSWLSGLF